MSVLDAEGVWMGNERKLYKQGISCKCPPTAIRGVEDGPNDDFGTNSRRTKHIPKLYFRCTAVNTWHVQTPTRDDNEDDQ